MINLGFVKYFFGKIFLFFRDRKKFYLSFEKDSVDRVLFLAGVVLVLNYMISKQLYLIVSGTAHFDYYELFLGLSTDSLFLGLLGFLISIATTSTMLELLLIKVFKKEVDFNELLKLVTGISSILVLIYFLIKSLGAWSVINSYALISSNLFLIVILFGFFSFFIVLEGVSNIAKISMLKAFAIVFVANIATKFMFSIFALLILGPGRYF